MRVEEHADLRAGGSAPHGPVRTVRVTSVTVTDGGRPRSSDVAATLRLGRVGITVLGPPHRAARPGLVPWRHAPDPGTPEGLVCVPYDQVTSTHAKRGAGWLTPSTLVVVFRAAAGRDFGSVTLTLRAGAAGALLARDIAVVSARHQASVCSTRARPLEEFVASPTAQVSGSFVRYCLPDAGR
ncbi:hypothetical protein Q6348_14610 [Isoptericola sp. b441]|uniref:Uncharacterized protein n=1 Tax=Actinotalea lenta TaxID=3064654 RepID=A0ABT9DD03_9CELL|nr:MULTISPECIES: hypothetical protein [unclassified Isoptericola]MDO8108426.1 hypothetical protein [Isoptericola sp. b441]MDO8119845.1 hypothetical protein [Isoptericola sp. b490]